MFALTRTSSACDDCQDCCNGKKHSESPFSGVYYYGKTEIDRLPKDLKSVILALGKLHNSWKEIQLEKRLTSGCLFAVKYEEDGLKKKGCLIEMIYGKEAKPDTCKRYLCIGAEEVNAKENK